MKKIFDEPQIQVIVFGSGDTVIVTSTNVGQVNVLSDDDANATDK